jgi:putative phosphoribosyl transferase
MNSLYKDRHQAGGDLAKMLSAYKDRSDVIVLGLPKGGVPVAYEVARYLQAPLDIFTAKKLGAPGNNELAIGAISYNGVVVYNADMNEKIPPAWINKVIKKVEKEFNKKEKKYRAKKAFPELTGKTVILVDDGLATGASMRAAIKALRQYKPMAIVAAVPVAPEDACEELNEIADRVVCPLTPRRFGSVGEWYEDFSQVSDAEVVDLLRKEQ